MPLVDPVFDFGRKGKPPQQQALLDWMAWELMDHGWSMKHLHRLIMQSQAIVASPASLKKLPQNPIDEANAFYWKRETDQARIAGGRDSLLTGPENWTGKWEAAGAAFRSAEFEASQPLFLSFQQ